jgi:hypothetical protein
MRRLFLPAAFAAFALPLAAQPNPFKAPKMGLKGVEVSYTLSGDLTGTALLAADGSRSVHRQNGTMKMMGKTTTTETWTLTTPDSMYIADLTKKQGSVMPNTLSAMSNAYDDLDGAGKKRLHQNMQDMGAMLSRMFNLSGINAGEKLSTKTYAGQECVERQFGPMTICTMEKAPIMLHSQMSLVCLNFEETATEVKLATPSADVFAPPAGVVFKPDVRVQQPDSVAKGFVLYLASQQLTDSIEKAKAQLQATQAQAGPGGKPQELTPEQKASMQQACETLKNLDIGKALADATNQMMKEIAEAAKRQALESAKEATTNKIKGLFKKPKIP